MTDQDNPGIAIFKEMEQAGWHAKAKEYDSLAGQVTVQAMSDILDAAKVAKGTRLLDIACGPGYGAGMAATRGAKALGIDFAEGMVSEAVKNFPGSDFEIGDAENLSFDDNSFDAAICAFGILHLADPDQAVREAFRVLKSGGQYAFTVWATPDSHEFFKLVLPAVQAHGNMDVPLPPAPPVFRFSDPEECEKALTAAGFVSIGTQIINPTWKASSAEQVLDMLYKSTVRTATLLELQDPAVKERIDADIVEGAEAFKRGSAYEMAWPVVMAWGTKP